MTAIGMTLEPCLFDNQLFGMVSGNLPPGINNSVSNLIKTDKLTTGNISNGAIPAVKTGLAGKISDSTTYLVKGAKNVASTAVNSTITATREAGNVIANEILPKPEPLSSTFLRNKFLSAVIVGGFMNGIRGVVKVIKGETDQEQAFHTVIKDTTIGAIGGLSFASGMGATASVFGKVMRGVPLSIAGLTIGTLAAIGVTELLKATVPAFADN